jgi:hypothetical protein
MVEKIRFSLPKNNKEQQKVQTVVPQTPFQGSYLLHIVLRNVANLVPFRDIRQFYNELIKLILMISYFVHSFIIS